MQLDIHFDWGAVLAAVIALPVGVLIEYFHERLARARTYRVRAASFLNSTAEQLSLMAEEIEDGHVPHGPGHYFLGLVKVLKDDTENVVFWVFPKAKTVFGNEKAIAADKRWKMASVPGGWSSTCGVICAQD